MTDASPSRSKDGEVAQVPQLGAASVPLPTWVDRILMRQLKLRPRRLRHPRRNQQKKYPKRTKRVEDAPGPLYSFMIRRKE